MDQQTTDVFRFRPRPFTDPIWMEYILREVELEEQVRNRLLATQLYGQGRSAAFTLDTTYLWYLPLRGMGQDSPYNLLWGQLVRWLAGQDVRNRQRGAGM